MSQIAFALPARLRVVGGEAFAGCRSLVYVYIPSGVTTVAPDAFADCPNVTVERAGE